MYSVNWKGRIALENKQVFNVNILEISKAGLSVSYSHALPRGANVSVEFHVRDRGEVVKIRAKTRVAFTTILANNRGVRLGLKFESLAERLTLILHDVLQHIEEGQYQVV